VTRSFDGGILIANRGEVALRIMRTARRLGYRTVAVYSDADRDAPHVAAADAAVRIGPASVAASYLNSDAIIDAGRHTGAQAIHPGYGFLSERPEFAARCEREGIAFIGPSAAAMRALGDKAHAKRLAEECGVPVVPGYHGDEQSDAAFLAAAEDIGFPVMVKAAAGGGGRGMRLVHARDELAGALASARAEATAAFGDGTLLLERALLAPRHIEVQIVADTFGDVVHFAERDCSLQRRYQKLVEESPSPAVGDALRARLGEAAAAVACASGYTGAGTIEFLVDGEGAFFFIEANARLQVEHTVTEAIADVDLVEWQIRIARGEPLPLRQDAIRTSGHAIEARLCAEDPANGFLPQSGTLLRWEPPSSIRVDHALAPGIAITPAYDSMIAKFIAHGTTREDARRSLIRALETTIALGATTNAAYLTACLHDPAFVAGDVTTAFAAEHPPDDAAVCTDQVAIASVLRYAASARRSGFGGWTDWSPSARFPSVVTLATERDGVVHTARIDPVGEHATAVTSAGPNGKRTYAVTLNDVRHTVELPPDVPDTGFVKATLDGCDAPVAYAEEGDRVYLGIAARSFAFRDLGAVPSAARARSHGDGKLRAPTSGRVLNVRVAAGDRVTRGAVAIVLEAMKMEHSITLPRDGTIAAVEIAAGDQVALGDVLVAYEPLAEA
jgi:geranyl-CoA carboxylase alpha subunit